jgi:hypothetical protein
MNFFGSEQGKSILKVHAHLMAKNAEGTGTGTVAFELPMLKRVFQQFQITVHAAKVHNVVSMSKYKFGRCPKKVVP